MISRTKAFITNSGTDITGLITVTAVTGRAGQPQGDLDILVPTGTPGLSVSALQEKSAGTHPTLMRVSLVDVRVPARNLRSSAGVDTRNSCRFSTKDGSRSRRPPDWRKGCVDVSVEYAHERERSGAARSKV